jgi:hypothetical protein
MARPKWQIAHAHNFCQKNIYGLLMYARVCIVLSVRHYGRVPPNITDVGTFWLCKVRDFLSALYPFCKKFFKFFILGAAQSTAGPVYRSPVNFIIKKYFNFSFLLSIFFIF